MLLQYAREFVQLATTLNFTSTAQRLNITQPSLSRHIMELEEQIGRPLLERNPVRLTPEGEHFLEHISSVIRDFDVVVQSTRDFSKARSRVVTFARPVAEGCSATLFYKAATNLSFAASDINLEPVDHSDLTLVECINAGLADCGFSYVEQKGLPSEYICSWPVCIWMRKDNSLAQKSPLYLNDLRDSVLAFSTDKVYEEWADGMQSLCRQAGFEPKYSRKANHHLVDFALSMRRDEVMITDSHIFSASFFDKRHFTVKTLADDPAIMIPSYLVYSPSLPREVVDQLLQALCDASREMDTDMPTS